jgi:hypothetical protein
VVNSAAPWQQAIDELERSGLIAPGGELVFVEDYVFASGTHLTVPLAQSQSLSNLVMAGSLRYTASANPTAESCGLLAHRTDSSAALEIGIASNGDLYLSDSGRVAALKSGIDLNLVQRVMFLILGERLVVYLDGQKVSDREIGIGSGPAGVRVQGNSPGATCEVNDLWVYRLPAEESSQCEIRAARGAVNKRGGPGTQFEIIGVLEDGAASNALQRSLSADGLTWWQLADRSWVREDVVSEQGACRALPVQN